MIRLKNSEELERMRHAGRVLAELLDELSKCIVVGATATELDDEAMRLMEHYGAEPVLLGYHPEFAKRPYPAAICVSVNDTVVHGIPHDIETPFRDGDVVSIDVSLAYEGMVVDSARTVGVGALNKDAQRLISVTVEACEAGIRAVRVGGRVGDIGAAVASVARAQGMGVVEELCGHGVGFAVHEEPQIPNVGVMGTGAEIVPGMAFAIEPMLTLGGPRVVFDTVGGYAVRTKDKSLSAHIEHTVIVTDLGAEVVTRSLAKNKK